MTWWTQVNRTYFLNFDWEMMTYWAIIGFWHATAYYRVAQDRALKASRLETRLAEAQLQALQRQLHPHFLFNTLNAISALMHRDVEAADQMLARLSDLLRMALDQRGAQEVPLKDELEFLQKYLEIEQTRFGDRLQVRFDVEPETLDAQVPNLILQPLVENSVRHAVAVRIEPGLHRDPRAPRGRRTSSSSVHDNGPGLPPRRRASHRAEGRRPGQHALAARAPVRRVAQLSLEEPPGGGLIGHGDAPVPRRDRRRRDLEADEFTEDIKGVA